MAEAGAPNPNFTMDGLFYTAEPQVTQVFARDFGRSVYLCPIAERRRMLLAIDCARSRASKLAGLGAIQTGDGSFVR